MQGAWGAKIRWEKEKRNAGTYRSLVLYLRCKEQGSSVQETGLEGSHQAREKYGESNTPEKDVS